MRSELSRRERQILDIVYRLGKATAREIQVELPDPPSNDAVRRMIRILEEKNLLKHQQEGRAFVYSPVVPEVHAREEELERVVDTFFKGSSSLVIASLLDKSKHDLSAEEIERFEKLIEMAKKDED